KVEVEERRLVLRGEKKAEREERRDGRYYSERSYGGFYRAGPLPCEIEPDKANARYRHGVLRVRLPKSDAAKARRKRITVN
ncbi:MAG TPA: Hsp20/alpha crystallin family protein, partial [Candidatus Hydrogenedentes bacterium]|nr:Hsp20/alpha crystallin family protein [Candidatus Hydrogenedentota bacterium]